MKPRNARIEPDPFDGLPTPDLTGLQDPDFDDLHELDFETLVNGLDKVETETPKIGKPRKLKAGEATGLAGRAVSMTRRTKRKIFYDLATSKRAVSAIGKLPDPEESFHCLMGGDYHGFDLVIAIHSLAEAPIDFLHLTTLGFNRHNMTHLIGMLDSGRVGSVRVLCSEYFASADTTTFLFAKKELEARGQSIVATRNHSKVMLFAIGQQRFTVESSANLRSCNNLEQFSLTHSIELYEFHRDWIEQVLTNGAK